MLTSNKIKMNSDTKNSALFIWLKPIQSFIERLKKDPLSFVCCLVSKDSLMLMGSFPVSEHDKNADGELLSSRSISQNRFCILIWC